MSLRTLTDSLEDALVAAVAKGVPFSTAATAAGVNPSAMHDWLAGASGHWRDGGNVAPQTQQRLQRFAQRIRQAQAEWEAKQVQGIAEAAEAINERTGQRDWRARAWLLNNHPQTRSTYHELKESVPDPAPRSPVYVQVRALPDAELEAILAQQALPEPATGT